MTEEEAYQSAVAKGAWAGMNPPKLEVKKLRVLDLFSGIGGFSLGLERTGGFETVAFCEIDPFCRRVLAKHWPGVPCFEDVTTLRGEDVGTVDVICGGFPCQDISYAGLGEGLDGARSGLWSEYRRLIGELRPAFVLVENVAALLGRGIDRVLGDLAAIGYDAEWHCVPAAAIGAPHVRDRLWLVAYPQHTDTNCVRPHREAVNVRIDAELRDEQVGKPRSVGAPLADPTCERRVQDVLNVQAPPLTRALTGQFAGRREAGGRQWLPEPNVGRVAHGVPHRVDRLKSLGNAVVPQIPEIIGRAILKSMRAA